MKLKIKITTGKIEKRLLRLRKLGTSLTALLTIISSALKPKRRLIRQELNIALIVLFVAISVIGILPNSAEFVSGAYSTSSVDSQGISHLASNTVNKTYNYDTTTDSSAAVQQQLGEDPNWQNGVTRQSSALKFDGSNDYVDAGSSAVYAVGSGNFTLEAWIYPSAVADSTKRGIFSTIGPGTAGFLFAYKASTGNKLYLETYDGSANPNGFSTTTITANTWTHVAVVRVRGGTYTFYINGVSAGTVTDTAGSITNSLNLSIGKSAASGGGVFSGIIDEARISSVARYRGSFTPPRRLNEDSNTIGLWHFDEVGCGGANPCYVYDSSIYGNNGQLYNGSSNSPAADGITNGPIFVTGANAIMDGYKGDNPDATTGSGGNPTGGATGAGNLTLGSQSSVTTDKSYDVKITPSPGMRLDGTNDKITADGTSPPTTFTIEAWIKPNLLGREQHIAEFGSVQFYLSSGNRLGTSSWSNLAGSTTFTTGRWYHVALVRDPSEIRMYVNGILDGRSSNRGANPGASFYIGQYYGGGNYWFNGTIDEVRVSTSVRYINAFTPDRRFATDGNTWGLWHLDTATCAANVCITPDISGNSKNGVLINGNNDGSGGNEYADYSTYGPLSTDGISAAPPAGGGGSSSTNWALPGYQFRQPLKITNNVGSIINPGYGVEATNNRGTAIDNNQSRADGKDWRVMYQPPNAKNSMSFDGSDKRITTTYGNGVNPTTQPLSFSMWVKTTTPSASQIFFSTDTGTNQRLYLSTYGGYWDFGIQSSAWGGSHGPAVISGVWTLFTVIMDGSNAKLYINGVFAVQKSYTSYAFASNFMIGRYVTGSYYFTGNLDDVRVYTRAITMSELSSLYSSGQGNGAAVGPNLSGWWKMDAGSGQIIRDYSGSENNAVLGADINAASDDPTWSTDGVVSTTQEVAREIPNGHALDFDGSASYAETATSAVYDIGTIVTASAWIKRDTNTADYESIVNHIKKTSAYDGYWIGSMADGKIMAFIGPYTNALRTTNVVSNGVWHLVSLVSDGTNFSIWVDGVKASADQAVGSITTTNVSVRIGRSISSDEYFDGLIDDVRIYNKPLNSQELSAIYNSGQGTPGKVSSGIVGWWKIDEGSGVSLTDYSGNTNTGDLTGHLATWVSGGGKVKSTNQTQFKTVAPIAASSTDSSYYLYYGNSNENSAAQTYSSYGLKFDGTNDYAITSTYATNPTDITFSAWIKPNAAGGVVLDELGQAGAFHDSNIEVGTDNTIKMRVWSGISATAATGITYGNWYHVVMVYDRTNTILRTYVNGSAGPTASGTKVWPTAGTLYYALGKSDTTNLGNGVNYSGQIDDARIYNRVLSPTEITALYSNAPYVSNTGLISWWKLDDGATSASALGLDAGSSANNLTMTNFNFDQNSNWITNTSLWHAATEPTVTNAIATPEQYSPVFYSWMSSGGSWSTSQPISGSLQQLGTDGVYLRWNLGGLYSVGDKYRISSLAIEALSTGSPQRGKSRAVPNNMNIIASNGGIDIIDANTNNVFARFPTGSNNIVGSGNSLSVKALNGRIYVASSDGLTEIRLDEDIAYRYTTSGVAKYQGTLADRADGLGYTTPAGNAIVDNSLQDIAPQVIGSSPPKQYVAVATDNGMSVINNITGLSTTSAAAVDSPVYDYAKTANDNYYRIALTSGGNLYGANTTAGGLDVYTTVNADSADQVGTSDLTYSTASTPALRSNTIYDIAVTEGTSAADYVSNQVAIGTDVGAEVINEHSTQASGFVDHHINPANRADGAVWDSKTMGNQLYFDGSNDYVNVPNAATLQLTGDMTISFWMNASNIGSGRLNPIDKSYSGEFALTLETSGSWHFYQSDGAASYISRGVLTTVSNGNLYHIVLTRNGTSKVIKGYINGANVSTSTPYTTAPLTSNSPVVIGKGYAGRIQGYMDDVRMYNTVLTDTQISQMYKTINGAPTAGLVGYWNFDERNAGANNANGQFVYDGSGNNNNGTLGANNSVGSDDPTRVSPSIAGSTPIVKAVGGVKTNDNGQALTFNGSSTWVNAGTSSTLKPTSGITVSAWVKANAIGDYDMILGDTNGNSLAYGYSMYLHTSAGGTLYFHVNNHGSYKASIAFTDTTTWHHVVGTYDKSKIRIYLDGKEGTPATLTADIDYTGAVGFGMGATAFSSDAYKLNGSEDDVRVYNRALTAAEIGTLFNGGIGSPNNTSSGLVGWWKFNEGKGTSTADSSGNNLIGSFSATAPTWSSGSPVKSQLPIWIGTNDGSGGGAVSAISLNTQRQITSYSTTNSSLPSNNISSMSIGGGGLALVGTDTGAWPAALAGLVVDDTAATPASINKAVRVEGGKVRVEGGTVRIKPN